ncbi:hypothetical protein F4774DRAFT_164799 [Daldinia eschscholtzii]|nr:hypothetical protein F4774DRAFT_164799 [Daldinia eschscholtzii]
MDRRVRVMIEAALEDALKDNIIFNTKWKVFEFLEKLLRAELIYENAVEIEDIWKAVFPHTPQTPSSELLEALSQDLEAGQIHNGDQVAVQMEIIRVPVFDEGAEPKVVSIFLPDTCRYSHANTKRCEGKSSYINIKTVRENRLGREIDGTIIVMWKYQKHQPIADQTARRTRCIILEGEDAKAMQVDILFGSEFEAGIRHATPSPSPPKEDGVSSPTVPYPITGPIVNNVSSEGMSPLNHKPAYIREWSFPNGLPDHWMGNIPSAAAFQTGTMPNYMVGASPLPLGVGPTTSTKDVTATMAAPVASTNCLLQNPPSPRQGKRKAGDEVEPWANTKRPQNARASYTS